MVMTKQQMIEAIRQRNRSAQQEFLARFDEQALRSYLDRLTVLADRRGPGSVWVRPNLKPAAKPRSAA